MLRTNQFFCRRILVSLILAVSVACCGDDLTLAVFVQEAYGHATWVQSMSGGQLGSTEGRMLSLDLAPV